MKLEDIPKKQDLSQAPEGYFERLPVRIADRVSKQTLTPVFSMRRVLIPAMAVLVFGIVAFLALQTNQAFETPESMLASVETSELVAFLEQNELAIDDSEVDELDTQALDSLEMEIYDVYNEEIHVEILDEFVEPDTL